MSILLNFVKNICKEGIVERVACLIHIFVDNISG